MQGDAQVKGVLHLHHRHRVDHLHLQVGEGELDLEEVPGQVKGEVEEGEYRVGVMGQLLDV